MTRDEKKRRVFLRWSWPAFILAVAIIASTGEGLLSLLARFEREYPTAYVWLDLFVTFLPFLFFVGLGLKTPAEQVRERIDRLKQQARTN
jgi:hypothetical protein